jgi:hypothetical protein
MLDDFLVACPAQPLYLQSVQILSDQPPFRRKANELMSRPAPQRDSFNRAKLMA